MLRHAALPLALLAFTGCAAHVPMSETVIFHDARTTPAHTSIVGLGMSFTQTLTATDFAEAEAVRLFDETDPERGIYSSVAQENAGRQSKALYLSLYGLPGEPGLFALSLTVGSAIGTDATVRLYRRNYLTFAMSSTGGGQAIFQHRAFNSSHLGATLGLAYRVDRLPFYVDTRDTSDDGVTSSYWLIGPNASVPVTSFGPRTSILLRGDPDEAGRVSGGIRAMIYVGYAPEYDRIVASGGLSFGVF